MCDDDGKVKNKKDEDETDDDTNELGILMSDNQIIDCIYAT